MEQKTCGLGPANSQLTELWAIGNYCVTSKCRDAFWRSTVVSKSGLIVPILCSFHFFSCTSPLGLAWAESQVLHTPGLEMSSWEGIDGLVTLQKSVPFLCHQAGCSWVFPMGLRDVKKNSFICMCEVQTASCSIINKWSMLHLGIVL